MSPVRRRAPEKNASKEEKRQNNKAEDSPTNLFSTRAFFYVFSGLFGLFAGICLTGYLRAPFTAQVMEPLPFVDFVGPFSINQKLTDGIKYVCDMFDLINWGRKAWMVRRSKLVSKWPRVWTYTFCLFENNAFKL